DSATQAGILENRLQMKEGDSVSEVVDWLSTLARKLDKLIQAHIDLVQAVRITGTDGIEYMATVRPEDYEDINGEYVYEVAVGSTQPRLPQMERASLLAALQLFANAPQLMTSARMVKRVLELHHIEDQTMVDEIVSIGRAMMQSQSGPPQQTGSLPNVGESRPVSAMGGQFGGASEPQTPA
ncbi:MAG TPA: hypothetical protein PLL10_02305, partial [Elusimicrobiales bacterium]|nr:hypothetical protein [Elusimicrobiales bacterium]